MIYKFILPFTARSKKNNRPIFFNKKTRRPFLGKSKPLRDFEKEATKLWKQQISDLGLAKPLKGKLAARYVFYYRGAQRADLCNLIVTINDLAQDAGVIENDLDIKLIERADVFDQSGVDRCEFFIRAITSEKPSEKVSFNEAHKYLQKIATNGENRKRKI